MAKKKSAARGATPAAPRATKQNVFAPVFALVDGPNSPRGAVDEIAAYLTANPHKDLAEVNAIVFGSHTNSEKLQHLRELLQGKV